MALLFADSCDHYASADIAKKWNTNTGSMTVNAAAGRNSTSGLRTSSTTSAVQVGVAASPSSIVMGCAFRTSGLIDIPILGTLETSARHTMLRLRADGKIDVCRDFTVLGTSTTALSINTWYYIELKTTIHDTTGSAELRINGVTEVTRTNVDTRNANTGVVGAVFLGIITLTSSQPTMDYDDIYVCDLTGTLNNDFLGDIRVQALLPNGNGNSSQLLGSDGNSTDNYLLVDEAAINGDTDYVGSATAGQKDTYAFADVGVTGTVKGVQVVLGAKKTDAGVRSIKSVTRIGSTDYAGSDKALGVDYQFHRQVLETKPSDSTVWTTAQVNSAEFGVEIV